MDFCPSGYVCGPSETNQRLFMERMQGRPDVMVRINMDPRPLVVGAFALIQKEVDRVLALAQNRRHVCIGTGVLPYEVEPNVVLRTRDLISSC